MIETLKLYKKNGRRRQAYKATIRRENGFIYFDKSPFALKDDIKAMEGARWMGFDEENPQKVWRIKDTQRNNLQLSKLAGQNIYEWFDRPLVEIPESEFDRPLLRHQRDIVARCLQYKWQIIGAFMGAGKTLAMIELMERSGAKKVIWSSPKAIIDNTRIEFRKWGLDSSIEVILTTSQGLKNFVDLEDVDGLIMDEATDAKNPRSIPATSAMKIATKIRANNGRFIVPMTGTPNAKQPTDVWSLAEIAYPGYLKEGSVDALTKRLAYMEELPPEIGFGSKVVGWREDEVELLGKRLKGLLTVYYQEDHIELPELTVRRHYLKPSAKLERVTQSIVKTAPNTMTGLTQLRTLSSGFMYRDVEDGEKQCPTCEGSKRIMQWFDPEEPDRTFNTIEMFSEEMTSRLDKHEVDCPNCSAKGVVANVVRKATEIPCQKYDYVGQVLDEEENVTGRLVCFGAFKGTLDRLSRYCLEKGWDVCLLDGRGYRVKKADGSRTDQHALEYWSDTENNKRVVFIANSESGGLGLTLIESRKIVNVEVSFKTIYRTQSICRVHRMNQKRPVEVIDLVHLPVDEKVLDVVEGDQRLEQLALSQLAVT